MNNEKQLYLKPTESIPNFVPRKGYHTYSEVMVSPLLLSLIEGDLEKFKKIIKEVDVANINVMKQMIAKVKSYSYSKEERLTLKEFLFKVSPKHNKNMEKGILLGMQYLNDNYNEYLYKKENGKIFIDEISPTGFSSQNHISEHLAFLIENNLNKLLPMYFFQIMNNKKNILEFALRKGNFDTFKEITNIMTNDITFNLNFKETKTNFSFVPLEEIKNLSIYSEVLYNAVMSTTKNNENELIIKLNFIFNNYHLGVIEDDAMDLINSNDVYVKMKEDKKYPFLYALSKKFTGVAKTFIEHGYTPNEKEIKEINFYNYKDILNLLNIKPNESIQNNDEELKQKISSFFTKYNKSNINGLSEFFNKASTEEKALYISIIEKENKSKYSNLNVSPNVQETKKSIDEDDTISFFDRALKSGQIEFLNIILDNGYKLNNKEYLLSWFTFFRLNSFSNDNIETINQYSKFANHLSEYPDEYKKQLLNLYIKGIMSNDVGKLSHHNTNFGLGLFWSLITKNKQIEMSDMDLILWSANFDNKLLKPKLESTIMLNVYMISHYEEKLKNLINIIDFKKQTILEMGSRINENWFTVKPNVEVIKNFMNNNMDQFNLDRCSPFGKTLKIDLEKTSLLENFKDLSNKRVNRL